MITFNWNYFLQEVPSSYKYSWGISYEYLPGRPEPTEEEIIRLWCHTSYLPKFFKLYISQTKKSLNFRSSHQRCSIKKLFLKNFSIFTRKQLCWSLFLIELQAWRPAILLKETPAQQRRCFPVNFAKFSKTPILKKIFEQQLLEFLRLTVNISS